MVSADAEPAASKATIATANRAIIPAPSAYRRDGPRNRRLTITIRRDRAGLWSTNPKRHPLPDLDHDAAANAPLDDVAGRVDDLRQPDLARHGRKFAPIEVALQPLPRQLPIGHWTHDRINADQRNAT